MEQWGIGVLGNPDVLPLTPVLHAFSPIVVPRQSFCQDRVDSHCSAALYAVMLESDFASQLTAGD